MPNNRPPGLMIRSQVSLNWLLEVTGETQVAIERIVREQQYGRHGLVPPATATVEDFFKGRYPIPFDPKLRLRGKVSPSWLMALEQQYPGVGRIFFHPLWDLLLSRLTSNAEWTLVLSLYPQAWIDHCRQHGQKRLAKTMKEFNTNMQKVQPRKRGPKTFLAVDRLELIHRCMLRLEDETESHMFYRSGLVRTFARAYASIAEEVKPSIGRKSIDGLARLVALCMEAAEIRDPKRCYETKNAIKTYLEFVRKAPIFEGVRDELLGLIQSECLDLEVPRYGKYAGIDDLPLTWQRFLLQNR
jgi:hypothetical protein